VEEITESEVDTEYLVLYLLVGTLLWRYLSVVFHCISEMIAWERWEGTIEYTFMAPVSRLTHMMGQTIFSVIYGILSTGVVFVVVTQLFHLETKGANLLGAMAVLAASSISFVGLGTMASVLPLLFPERGAQMTNVVHAVLLLISGVYYPITVLPPWMQTLAHVSPAKYALEAMRSAVLAQAGSRELMPDLALLTAMGVVTMPIALWVFSRVEYYAKRSGRLKRSG